MNNLLVYYTPGWYEIPNSHERIFVDSSLYIFPENTVSILEKINGVYRVALLSEDDKAYYMSNVPFSACFSARFSSIIQNIHEIRASFPLIISNAILQNDLRTIDFIVMTLVNQRHVIQQHHNLQLLCAESILLLLNKNFISEAERIFSVIEMFDISESISLKKRNFTMTLADQFLP